MTYKILYGSLLFLLGITSTLLFTQSSRQAVDSINVTEKPASMSKQQTDERFNLALEQINQKLNDLNQGLNQVRNDVDAISLNNSSNDAISLNNSSNMAEQELMEQQIAEQQGLEERFQSESRDNTWSHQVENKVNDAFMEKSEHITAVNMQCKSSMCKLTLARSHDQVDTDDFMQAFETGVEWDGEMYLNFDPNTGEAIAFLARPGQTLSMMDQ